MKVMIRSGEYVVLSWGMSSMGVGLSDGRGDCVYLRSFSGFCFDWHFGGRLGDMMVFLFLISRKMCLGQWVVVGGFVEVVVWLSL